MLNKCTISEMSLDEAIIHCKEVVKKLIYNGECSKCIAEHYQLLNWLEELKSFREINKI